MSEPMRECADGRMIPESQAVQTADGRWWPEDECGRDDDDNLVWDHIKVLESKAREESRLSDILYDKVKQLSGDVERLLATNKKINYENDELEMAVAISEVTIATLKKEICWLKQLVRRLDPEFGQGGC
jgi:hypothetical protein